MESMSDNSKEKEEKKKRYGEIIKIIVQNYINILNLSPSIIAEVINSGLEENKENNEIVEQLKVVYETKLREIENLSRNYTMGPEEGDGGPEALMSKKGSESESETETKLKQAPPEEMSRFSDVAQRLQREVPESEVLKRLLESGAKIGELMRRLYQVKYSPRILRRIIFTHDENEAQELLTNLRNGKYNIPATLWRWSKAAILFHKLGIKVETKDELESLALIAEKARDMKEQLNELTEKILEVEDKVKEMKSSGLDQEKMKKELDELAQELNKTMPNELSNIEKGIGELEKYFGGRENIFSKFKPNIGLIASSVSLWGLAIGWFLPLLIITKSYDQIEKSSLTKK